MSYELRREEPLADGIRRIVVEQVDIAIQVLSHPQCNGGVDEAVHEARKSFKRVRSALRLARGVVGNESYHRESVRFRILAGALASLRESAVSVLSIDELREDVAPELRPGAFSELRAHLVERHTVALWQTVEREEALIRVTGRLRNARRQLRDLPTRDCSDLAWTPGVRRAYRDGRIGWPKPPESMRPMPSMGGGRRPSTCATTLTFCGAPGAVSCTERRSCFTN